MNLTRTRRPHLDGRCDARYDDRSRPHARSGPGLGIRRGVSEATLTDLSDGDSFHVDIAGAVDEVRLIGIDTPEIGSCEATAAKTYLGRLLSGARSSSSPERRTTATATTASCATPTSPSTRPTTSTARADGMLDVWFAGRRGPRHCRDDPPTGRHGSHAATPGRLTGSTCSVLVRLHPEQAAGYTAEQAEAAQAQAEQAQATSEPPGSPDVQAPAQPAQASPAPAVTIRCQSTVHAPPAPTPTRPVVVALPPDGNDNPYDDGGPRNPDGSCPPGGCWPGT